MLSVGYTLEGALGTLYIDTTLTQETEPYYWAVIAIDKEKKEYDLSIDIKYEKRF